MIAAGHKGAARHFSSFRESSLSSTTKGKTHTSTQNKQKQHLHIIIIIIIIIMMSLSAVIVASSILVLLLHGSLTGGAAEDFAFDLSEFESDGYVIKLLQRHDAKEKEEEYGRSAKGEDMILVCAV